MVVVRDGRVIAERYAPGYGIDTQVMGWSATKSVTNALIGILARQGKLSLEGPAPIAAWANPKDPRHAISIDNMLRMNSGLDIGDSLIARASTAFDPSAYMVFGVRDMAAFAEKAPLKTAPGTQSWNYTNGNTILLSRIIRDNAGGDAASTLAFARRELFDKLGMRHVTLEFDAVGTPIGSSHMLASARDWARFGLLYLNDGVVGGERLLPPGWVDYSAAPTPAASASATPRASGPTAATARASAIRIAHGIPADAFFARGANGQYVIIVPSQRLVVARFGAAFTERDDMDVVARLVADVIAAMPPSCRRDRLPAAPCISRSPPMKKIFTACSAPRPTPSPPSRPAISFSRRPASSARRATARTCRCSARRSRSGAAAPKPRAGRWSKACAPSPSRPAGR